MEGPGVWPWGLETLLLRHWLMGQIEEQILPCQAAKGELSGPGRRSCQLQGLFQESGRGI